MVLITILSTSMESSIIGVEVIVSILLLTFSYFETPYAVAISIFMIGVFREPLKPTLETFGAHDVVLSFGRLRRGLIVIGSIWFVPVVFPFKAHNRFAELTLLSYALYI